MDEFRNSYLDKCDELDETEPTKCHHRWVTNQLGKPWCAQCFESEQVVDNRLRKAMPGPVLGGLGGLMK